MNKMEKKIKAWFLATLCLMLTACLSEPAGLYFDYMRLRREVTTIELINYDSPDVREVGRKEDILPFNFDKMEIIETLEVEHHEFFLYDISTIYFHIRDDSTKYLTSGSGLAIRIIYENEKFVIMFIEEDLNFAGEYNKDGNVGEYMLCDIDVPWPIKSFIELISPYFETEIS